LVPFFYSQAVQASLREGRLMHKGPGTHQYLLGDALMAAVMSNEKPEREIVFPPGEWLDYWDNRAVYRGGETRTLPFPEDRSPLFVKAGAVIALNVENDAAGHGTAASRGWRTLDVYPAAAATTTVVWDTAQYPPVAARDRSEVEVRAEPAQITVRLTGGPARDTILRVWSPATVTAVERDGRPLPQRAWRYDAADQRLWVRLPKAASFRVSITRR
jgi:alpha-D-xyloside xylohydrolase